jgi:poly-gamma-glutamate capsule biosynthesis protein CapA/YwtB (metallophosphatase superfamily)
MPSSAAADAARDAAPAAGSQPAAARDGGGDPGELTLLLCGDVMTGRGVDQVLPHPGDPQLFESYVHSARQYVELAEGVSGKIDRPVDFGYVWGDALHERARLRPAACIVNLETAVTVSQDAWPGKGIHYRMHPANVPCLSALPIDCCVIANNHVLDWGRGGLSETIAALAAAGIRCAGAGANAAEAGRPAVLETAGGARVLVFGFATEDSGVPPEWRATGRRSGVNLLRDLSGDSVDRVARDIEAQRRSGDIVVVSLHWGGNWGFDITPQQRNFAHGLLERAGVHLVHGHSSHHVKGIEVHHGGLILYGCGDFLDDYEGIGGYQAYRGDLALMYFPVLDRTDGRLRELLMVPTSVRRLRVTRATAEQAQWLEQTLNREGGPLGTAVQSEPDGTLRLRWAGSGAV